MNRLQAGFSRVNITPMMGIEMIGYFPMREAYDEGGYESRSSFFKAGVAEYIIEEGKKLLAELKE